MGKYLVEFLGNTNAHAICPDKIYFVLDKIEFVQDELFLSETKYFVHG